MFIVLGVHPGRIDQLVQIKVAAQERRLKNCPTVEGSKRRIEKCRARVAAAPPRKPISGDFETLAGAREYARLALASGMEFVALRRLGQDEIEPIDP